LVKIDERPAESDVADTPPTRVAATIQRIVRDTKLGQQVKAMYDYQCQICGVRLEGLAGPYAEAAHIRPLGTPHHGPDSLENLLCLCPNHHVLLDFGGIGILDDLTLIGAEGKLHVKAAHKINAAHLRYRRAHFYRGI
jgi:putative restriction endonuclease